MWEDRIRELGCWRTTVSLERLSGGITNVNYVVHDGQETFVVRVCEDLSYLGIDRRNERLCQQAAAQAGVSPAVVHAEEGILVSEFVDGRTLSEEDVRDPSMVQRLAEITKQLHGARETLTGEMLYFCPFQTVRTYTATARRLGALLPDDIDVLLEDSNQLSRAMRPFQPTLCHNDLLAANIMDDGQQLWLIDWEYAAIGNPLFDIAGISANCGLEQELEASLLKAYAGNFDRQQLREVHVLKTVSLLREALWAVIQTKASDIDFDYGQYAQENFDAYKTARQRLEE